MSLVTVITPVHNRPYFLEEAVKSIQQQTYTDWEHIIIDDGSDNPETQEILTKISCLPKVSIYRCENRGLGGARNFAIERAKGDYILTIDDDDRWDTSFIEQAVGILNKDSAVGVVTSWLQMFGEGKEVIKPLGGGLKNFLINNNSIHALFRKECWEKAGRYDEDKFFQAYTDWDLWLRITALGYKVHVIEKPLFFYRIHKTPSMLQQAEDKHLELFHYLIKKNKNIYADNVTECLLLMERKIIDTRKFYTNRDLFYRSKRFIKTIFKKIKR